MDNQCVNMKNVLVELESLKSKEAIFKMKENNLLRDKEILEDSINKFQSELTEKSELIRLLRRDLNTQSSNLYKDLEIKNNEFEKVILENQDLKKQNVIFQETIEHHIQKIETIKLEMDKQLKFYEREIDCKSKLAGFYESSSQQKENKLSFLGNENEHNKHEINDLKSELSNLKSLNDEMNMSYEESYRQYQNDLMEKDQEIERMKNEIIQLQQNGISEFHLEKMNPTAAATLKVLKSSKGLMEVYSELHSKISEVDQLQMEKDRLIRNKDTLELDLHNIKSYVDRINHESEELRKTNDSLKSRLFSRVTDLEKSKSKVSDLERQLLVCRKNLQSSHNEIERLNEQVRLIIVYENGSQIKQEAVDADSGLYASVAELQEINRSLRINNENLTAQLETSDSQQYKQRYDELKKDFDKLNDEAKQLKQENSANKSHLILHEKQIKLLRYLIELKSPGTTAAIESGLNRIESGNVVNIDCEDEPEIQPLHLSVEDLTHDVNSDQLLQQESAINELLDNKRKSDEVYVFSIEQMRTQLMEWSKKCSHINDKLESCSEQLRDEKEINEKYYQECALLRSLNKNLSTNTITLESHIEDLKMKLQSKISLLSERKADIDSCKNSLDLIKSENLRLKIERDELSKTIDVQEKILANISSLKSGVDLAEHFNRIQAQNRIETLEKELVKSLEDIKEKEESIDLLSKQLEESRALNALPLEINDCDDKECQVNIQICEEGKTDADLNSPVIIDNSELIACRNEIVELQKQLIAKKSLSDQSISELQSVIEKHEIEMKDLTEKCEFFETQIGLQEKARQEILNENIKLSEEAHKLNASLKQDLHNTQDELVAMKIRLEEAETVERTVQEVIDKYVKEANEAKAKYKRELTLHAADSKLLESLRKEIEDLQSKDRFIDDGYDKLKLDLKNSENSRKQLIEEMRLEYKELENKLKDCENRNESLYEQLKEINEHGSNSSYLEIIEDLKNQINIGKMSSNLSNIQKERYENEISRLNEELNDTKEQSNIVIDRLNKSQSEDNSSLTIETEVIRESNYVLRQQKEQLEQTVITFRSETEDLKEKICNLELNVSELTDQKNSLFENKIELEEEKNRWKERCTKLVERAEQMDPEQYKQACNDRDKLRKQVQELESNLKELKQILEMNETKTKSIIEENQENLKNLEKNLFAKKQEIVEEKGKLENLNFELKQKEDIVAKLKDIGRKHKGESEKRFQTIIELEEQISRIQEQLRFLQKEKDDLMNKTKKIELDLEEKSEELSEMKTRCDLLEKMNKENSFKIQLKDNMIGELNVNLNQLRTNLKRTNSEDSNEASERKKMRLFQEDDSVSSDEDGSFSNKEDYSNEEVPENEEKLDETKLDDNTELEGTEESNNLNVDIMESGECSEDNNEVMEEENIDENTDNITLQEEEENEDNDDNNKEIEENVNNEECEIIEATFEKDDNDNDNADDEEEEEYKNQVVGAFCYDQNEELEDGEQTEEDDDEEYREENYERETVDHPEKIEVVIEDDDNDSVVLIESDTEEKDSLDANEEDFEAIVQQVENSLENLESNVQSGDDHQQSIPDEMSESEALPPKDTNDSTWDEKLINMVTSSSVLPVETSNGDMGSQPNMRTRLRRPLRRPNPTD